MTPISVNGLLHVNLDKTLSRYYLVPAVEENILLTRILKPLNCNCGDWKTLWGLKALGHVFWVNHFTVKKAGDVEITVSPSGKLLKVSYIDINYI